MGKIRTTKFELKISVEFGLHSEHTQFVLKLKKNDFSC